MSYLSKELGDSGEDLALEFLSEKGYELVGRKVKLFCGEIDLLMLDKKSLVIVEVKTKSDQSYGVASEMITLKKRKKLIQLAKALMQKYPKMVVRIDVMAIDYDDNVEHLVSAVEEE